MKRTISLLAAVFAFSVVAAQAAGTQGTGWISDSMCGAKHMGSGAACVKQCIGNGMKPVFVDTQKHVWSIDNPDAVKSFYGDHVAVKMSMNAADKSVHIDSIQAAK